ncbi:hypothetical protein AYI70_g1305 [Smittium culicis]|uniref:Uncharacterized protein n=1 Tax=Smittium culicis TaxID=133412 RepID=A0A1R1YD51_9FUNG|nr:hypothetical protein AYI70_g9139 [Smittium culicis]OMJ24842.1 hypothetical protein AYI70_g1305 [Smittium culicis]
MLQHNLNRFKEISKCKDSTIDSIILSLDDLVVPIINDEMDKNLELNGILEVYEHIMVLKSVQLTLFTS